MDTFIKNIQIIIIGVLIMIVWVTLWFIINLYISNLYKQYGVIISYLSLITASILLYYLSGNTFNWITIYGV